jgi:hypothetical protein
MRVDHCGSSWGVTIPPSRPTNMSTPRKSSPGSTPTANPPGLHRCALVVWCACGILLHTLSGLVRVTASSGLRRAGPKAGVSCRSPELLPALGRKAPSMRSFQVVGAPGAVGALSGRASPCAPEATGRAPPSWPRPATAERSVNDRRHPGSSTLCASLYWGLSPTVRGGGLCGADALVWPVLRVGVQV